MCCVTCSKIGWGFTNQVHFRSRVGLTCNLQALANKGSFYFSQSSPRESNTSLVFIHSFARAGKDYLLCFIPVQLFSSTIILFLYREICILLLVTYGIAVSRFSRTAKVRCHSSIKPCWEFSLLRTFIPSAYNTVYRRLGFRKRSNAGLESKTSTAVNKQPNTANTSTASSCSA